MYHQQVTPKFDPSIVGEQNTRQFEKESVPVFPSTSDTGDDICRDAENTIVEIKDDDEGDEENLKRFGGKRIGEIASTFLGRRLLNTQ